METVFRMKRLFKALLALKLDRCKDGLLFTAHGLYIYCICAAKYFFYAVVISVTDLDALIVAIPTAVSISLESTRLKTSDCT